MVVGGSLLDKRIRGPDNNRGCEKIVLSAAFPTLYYSKRYILNASIPPISVEVIANHG